ncbi:unnamed protein product [Blepharisma stoltei]|uniref:C2 domain-containing protein n=1 Tax=Blepharisma stoltei TaxID=1481888 RepID=A0AAU9JTW6_9CILI|nr:unnamed protein product [Blepharisma stoltei]
MNKITISSECAKLSFSKDILTKIDVRVIYRLDTSEDKTDICVGAGKFPTWNKVCNLQGRGSKILLQVIGSDSNGQALIGEAQIDLKEGENWFELSRNGESAGQIKLKIAVKKIEETLQSFSNETALINQGMPQGITEPQRMPLHQLGPYGYPMGYPTMQNIQISQLPQVMTMPPNGYRQTYSQENPQQMLSQTRLPPPNIPNQEFMPMQGGHISGIMRGSTGTVPTAVPPQQVQICDMGYDHQLPHYVLPMRQEYTWCPVCYSSPPGQFQYYHQQPSYPCYYQNPATSQTSSAQGPNPDRTQPGGRQDCF